MQINLVEELRSLIGQPPVGYEFLEYIVVAFLLIFVVYSAVSILAAIFRWIGGN